MMYPRRLLAVICAATVLVLPMQSHADDDLASRRSACQAEARQRIKPPRAGSVELFQITLEGRQAYIRECMARAPTNPFATGSLKNPAKQADALPQRGAPRQQ